MYKKHHYSNQHGMATLAITVILLFVMTLVTLYTAKTSIKEQQISANQYRAEQSLSTANAALDWGVANLDQADGKFCDEELAATPGTGYTCPAKIMCTIANSDQTKCTFAYNESNWLSIDHSLDVNDVGDDDALSIGASEMYYAFVKTDGTELEHIPVKGDIGERFINDGDGVTRVHFANIKVYGIGHSDDETGRRVVSLDVDTSNIFGDPGLGASAFPLISKSTSKSTGNATIINRFDNRTIWSGDELIPDEDSNLSGSTSTYVLHPDAVDDDGQPLSCNDIKNHIKCVSIGNDGSDPEYAMEASKGKDSVNADIIDGDSNLGNLDPDDFFVNFFGKSKEEMRTLAKESGLYVKAISKKDLTDLDGNTMTWADLADYTPLVWMDATSVEYYDPTSADLAQLGTEGDPMVLIVDGDLGMGSTGGLERLLVGALYVTGSWDASGQMVVQGMCIIETESKLGGNGNPTLVYDADLFNGKMGPPPGTVAGVSPGSWRDWE